MIRELTPEGALFVARNMRRVDQDEVMAVRWSENLDDLAKGAFVSSGVAWEARDKEGIPFCIFGCAFNQPGIGVCWMVATREFREEAAKVTLFCKTVTKKLLAHEKINQLVIYSSVAHKQAHKLIKSIGFKNEPLTLEMWGKGGEDFLLFQRLNKEVA